MQLKHFFIFCCFNLLFLGIMSFLPVFTVQTPSKTPGNEKKTSDGSGSGKSKKLRVTTGQQSDCLDAQLIIKAINNSFTKKMSGNNQQLDPNNLIMIVAEFALSSLEHKKALDISARQYCIVQIDESYIIDKGIGTLSSKLLSLMSCSNHLSNQQRSQYNIENHIQLPSTIRPYCLVLNMNSRELHFQSHQESKNRFFINLDTIPVVLEAPAYYGKQSGFSDANQIKRYLNYPIILNVKNKQAPLIIRIYITNFTLPFPFNGEGSIEKKLEYLLECKQSLLNVLRKSILQSRGNQLNLSKVIDLAIHSQKMFYNTRYATQEQFVRYCESGDILLFKDSHTMAKVQRTLTNSQYDHVAIVYKSQQVGISIFESNSTIGVGLALWRKLIRSQWYEGIDKIVWRKLQIDKKPADFDKKIDQFVKGNLNKKFGLSLPKLLKFKAVTYSKQQKKSYFCSQLAAELYRYLGLLEQSKSSSQYWPRDFADGNGIQILNGALDPERQIIFEQPLLNKNYPGLKKMKN